MGAARTLRRWRMRLRREAGGGAAQVPLLLLIIIVIHDGAAVRPSS
jgi:hypothetical protein